MKWRGRFSCWTSEAQITSETVRKTSEAMEKMQKARQKDVEDTDARKGYSLSSMFGSRIDTGAQHAVRYRAAIPPMLYNDKRCLRNGHVPRSILGLGSPTLSKGCIA